MTSVGCIWFQSFCTSWACICCWTRWDRCMQYSNRQAIPNQCLSLGCKDSTGPLDQWLQRSVLTKSRCSRTSQSLAPNRHRISFRLFLCWRGSWSCQSYPCWTSSPKFMPFRFHSALYSWFSDLLIWLLKPSPLIFLLNFKDPRMQMKFPVGSLFNSTACFS